MKQGSLWIKRMSEKKKNCCCLIFFSLVFFVQLAAKVINRCVEMVGPLGSEDDIYILSRSTCVRVFERDWDCRRISRGNMFLLLLLWFYIIIFCVYIKKMVTKENLERERKKMALAIAGPMRHIWTDILCACQS